MKRPNIKEVREAVKNIADVKYDSKSKDYHFYNCFLNDAGRIYEAVKHLGLTRKRSAEGIYFEA